MPRGAEQGRWASGPPTFHRYFHAGCECLPGAHEAGRILYYWLVMSFKSHKPVGLYRVFLPLNCCRFFELEIRYLLLHTKPLNFHTRH